MQGLPEIVPSMAQLFICKLVVVAHSVDGRLEPVKWKCGKVITPHVRLSLRQHWTREAGGAVNLFY